MLKIKNITIKNFMSVGNISQAVNFSEDELVLVLGENLDLGGNDSRNGVGKSSLLNALTYALYGVAITNIRKDNLVNKINSKGMLVTLDFDIDGTSYRIERGRKPGIFKFLVNGSLFGEDETNEAQGDNRVTQKEIETQLGLSCELYKHILALNTFTVPFLSQRANDQRQLIEELLGITKLSEKAEILKEQLKVVRDDVRDEEFRIKAIQQSNKQMETKISSLNLKSVAWAKKKEKELLTVQNKLIGLMELDVETEIEHHRTNKLHDAVTSEYDKKVKERKAIEKEIKIYKKNLVLAEKNLSMTHDTNLCPTCNQDMDAETHESVHADFEEQADAARNKIEEKQVLVDGINEEIDTIVIPAYNNTYYDEVEDAYDHKSLIDATATKLEQEADTVNPFIEQISLLKQSGIREVNYADLDKLTNHKDHQEFLLKLLTNKDSFIRKKIIDRNLLYLNNRLSTYLEKMGLPHTITFKSDLDVEITELGRDYDFDNLSRGEKTRLILSMSWAFRDVYENLNGGINLMFTDELLDCGLDASGVEDALKVFKSMVRDGRRNVFLISHRDELIGRINSVLKVTKDSGFTTFSKEEG